MQFKTLTLAALASTALSQDLVATLQSADELSTLTTYLSAYPDFVAQLSSLSNITLLAPNNEAFTAFLETPAASAITNNQTEVIQALFSYHVLNGSYSGFDETAFVHTALLPPMYTNVTGGQVIEAVPGDNGVTIFSGLLSESSTTGNMYNFDGGVVHVIDTVLTIPPSISETAVEFNLSSIVGALTDANLVETLDGLTDVTVFVPNNDAFQAIGSALPDLTMEQITSILTYHVVNGTVGYSTLLMDGMMLPTLQGNELTVHLVDDQVYVNSALVTVPNVLVANGVVHVIDNVLNPNNADAMDDSPDDGMGSPAFSGASSATDAPYTSGVATTTSMMETSAMASSEASPTIESSGEGAAAPMKTGAVGAAALFGGAALVMNL